MKSHGNNGEVSKSFVMTHTQHLKQNKKGSFPKLYLIMEQKDDEI